MLRDERAHRRDVGRGRLGPALDRSRERVRCEVAKAGRRDEVAGDGLGVRNGHAVEARPDVYDDLPQWSERAVEPGEAGAVRGGMARIGALERACDCLADAAEL